MRLANDLDLLKLTYNLTIRTSGPPLSPWHESIFEVFSIPEAQSMRSVNRTPGSCAWISLTLSAHLSVWKEAVRSTESRMQHEQNPFYLFLHKILLVKQVPEEIRISICIILVKTIGLMTNEIYFPRLRLSVASQKCPQRIPFYSVTALK